MKYIVAGNYTRFAVTLTQKSGELIVPYIPTDGDVVQIRLYGARRFDYPNYEQVQNVLTFEDNGCLNVGLYCLEVKITEANTHKLRCMYREQIRVVASNDDVPTDASFTDDDVQLSGQFDIVASTEIVVDDELSETSENPVQNKVVTLALNTKYDNINSTLDSSGWDITFQANGVGVYELFIGGATATEAGLFLPSEKAKLAGVEAEANKTIVDSVLSISSLNPVENRTIAEEFELCVRSVEINTEEGSYPDKVAVYAYLKNGYGVDYILAATSTAAGVMSAADKEKLDALPTNEKLTTALAGKQDRLTFDIVPTQNSNNPVTSGGLYNVLGDIESVLDNILGN